MMNKMKSQITRKWQWSFLLIYFKCTCACVCVCVCVCVLHLSLLRPEKGIRAAWAGVTGSCEPANMGAGMQTHVLRKRNFTTKPSLLVQ
jgi:hypothetical protein